MKDKTLIILAASLAVLICLILSVLLFYAVSPRFLVILSFIIGVIAGICITLLINYIIKNIRDKKPHAPTII